MASAARSLRLVSRSCRSQKVLPQLGSKVFVAWKSVGGGAIKDSKVVIDDHRDKPTPFDHWADQDAEIERRFRGLGPQDIARIIMREDADAELGVDQRLESIIDKEKGFQANNPAADAHKEMIDSTRPLRITKVPKKESFWDDEEQDPDLITNDDSDTFDENDMTDIAHAKLEEIREQRAYARTIVWEMPLLSKYVVPFQLPKGNQPLRFRYTSYMGEFHPAEKKVVVEFSPQDFGLTREQQTKLIKLVGPRYNPEKKVIKMSCESFEHQAQNKRHLAETVEKLVAEAKDGKDTFEDIPLDSRHHPIKEKPKFPKSWRISSKRTKEIENYRQEVKQLEAAKKAEGTFVDGAEVIKKAFESRQHVAIPVDTLKRSGHDGRRNARY